MVVIQKETTTTKWHPEIHCHQWEMQRSINNFYKNCWLKVAFKWTNVSKEEKFRSLDIQQCASVQSLIQVKLVLKSDFGRNFTNKL